MSGLGLIGGPDVRVAHSDKHLEAYEVSKKNLRTLGFSWCLESLWISLSARFVARFWYPQTPRSIPDILHTQRTQKHVTFSTLCRTTLEKSLLDELGRPRRVAVDSAEYDQYKSSPIGQTALRVCVEPHQLIPNPCTAANSSPPLSYYCSLRRSPERPKLSPRVAKWRPCPSNSRRATTSGIRRFRLPDRSLSS